MIATHELEYNGQRYRVTIGTPKPIVKVRRFGRGTWRNHQFWGAPKLRVDEMRALMARAMDWHDSWENLLAFSPRMPRMLEYGSGDYV